MSVSFEGYNERILTFEKDGDIAVGNPVKISKNGKVSECSSSGEKFCGFAVSVRDNLVGVQMSGYREASYTEGSNASDPKISLGYSIVTADDSNKLAAANAGNTVLVVNNDTTNKIMGFIF